jgi:hypothetical protein
VSQSSFFIIIKPALCRNVATTTWVQVSEVPRCPLSAGTTTRHRTQPRGNARLPMQGRAVYGRAYAMAAEFDRECGAATLRRNIVEEGGVTAVGA